jgi:hypothetical protein
MNNLITCINEKLVLQQKITPKEKRQVQKAIYKELQKNNTTGKFYRDEYWAGVDAVRKDVQTALDSLFRKTHHEYESSIYPVNGGYRKSNDGMSQWKEYVVDIFIYGKKTPFMTGYLNCHAAGTIEEPFKMYDMSFVLSC